MVDFRRKLRALSEGCKKFRSVQKQSKEAISKCIEYVIFISFVTQPTRKKTYQLKFFSSSFGNCDLK